MADLAALDQRQVEAQAESDSADAAQSASGDACSALRGDAIALDVCGACGPVDASCACGACAYNPFPGAARRAPEGRLHVLGPISVSLKETAVMAGTLT